MKIVKYMCGMIITITSVILLACWCYTIFKDVEPVVAEAMVEFLVPLATIIVGSHGLELLVNSDYNNE